ncbi:hypothetical protein H7347_00555 [Corynebacterium sp. zg-331]|uniref:hypothetical protein n=1 Tax=unclassified Corynebacterium TaxID=2624378 RepID=UPI00128B4F88|nr:MULTISPECIES: hypothetical protein [unclassified Corynebacterium]MBC3185084.1 hypothetical protein [Corynebacterium sp. zg-331]MPV51584.1 hypothetical protein [Corynebacterium sp. zg331]
MTNTARPTPTGEIAAAMQIPANQQSTYRRRLIERGLIAPPGTGTWISRCRTWANIYASARCKDKAYLRRGEVWTLGQRLV